MIALTSNCSSTTTVPEAKMKQILNDYGSLLDMKTVEGESEEVVEKKTSKLN